MLKLWTLPVGEYGTNCYLVTCPDTGQALLLDPGGDGEVILELCRRWRVTRILLTHGHADHTMALDAVRESLKAPVGIHPADATAFGIGADFALQDRLRLGVGRRYVRVVHVPGHTAGSIALRFDRRAVVGDAIFPGGPGHTATPEALETALLSLQRTVFTWPDDTLCYPGHGDPTTVGTERPFFQEFLARPRSTDTCGDVAWR